MSRAVAIALISVAGCKSPGLESTSPANDPSTADAPIPTYTPTANPLEGSAFEGELVSELEEWLESAAREPDAASAWLIERGFATHVLRVREP